MTLSERCEKGLHNPEALAKWKAERDNRLPGPVPIKKLGDTECPPAQT